MCACVRVCVYVCVRVCEVMVHLEVSSPPLEAEQLLVLSGDEVDGGVLEQGREHEQQAHGHPDVNSLHIGHLWTGWRVWDSGRSCGGGEGVDGWMDGWMGRKEGWRGDQQGWHWG